MFTNLRTLAIYDELNDDDFQILLPIMKSLTSLILPKPNFENYIYTECKSLRTLTFGEYEDDEHFISILEGMIE
jgi:hypothetical protein